MACKSAGQPRGGAIERVTDLQIAIGGVSISLAGGTGRSQDVFIQEIIDGLRNFGLLLARSFSASIANWATVARCDSAWALALARVARIACQVLIDVAATSSATTLRVKRCRTTNFPAPLGRGGRCGVEGLIVQISLNIPRHVGGGAVAFFRITIQSLKQKRFQLRVNLRIQLARLADLLIRDARRT